MHRLIHFLMICVVIACPLSCATADCGGCCGFEVDQPSACCSDCPLDAADFDEPEPRETGTKTVCLCDGAILASDFVVADCMYVAFAISFDPSDMLSNLSGQVHPVFTENPHRKLIYGRMLRHHYSSLTL